MSAIQMPIVALSAENKALFIVGNRPRYGEVEDGIWQMTFSDEGETLVNGIFDNGDHYAVEVLTEMGLNSEEKGAGVRSISIIKIPSHSVTFIKAGYLRGMPSEEPETALPDSAEEEEE